MKNRMKMYSEQSIKCGMKTQLCPLPLSSRIKLKLSIFITLIEIIAIISMISLRVFHLTFIADQKSTGCIKKSIDPFKFKLSIAYCIILDALIATN